MRILIISKRYLIITLILIALPFIFTIGYYNVVKTNSTLVSLNKVIIVDAGHGGVDGGAISRNDVKESDINLKIALKLRNLLEEAGAIVLLTRDVDMGLYSEGGSIRDKKNEDLKNRRDFIDESQADLLISVHLNSFSQSQYYGAQTFYPPHIEASKEAAKIIQEELIRVLDNGNRRVAKPKNNVYLLKHTTIPTVLVECGFLSNPEEELALQKEKYQEKVAWSIYIGILRFFNENTDNVFNE